MQIWVTVKYIFMFTVKYIKYIYYGLKQRIFALFKLEIGIFDFIKSLFKIPFESWIFTRMELNYS